MLVVVKPQYLHAQKELMIVNNFVCVRACTGANFVHVSALALYVYVVNTFSTNLFNGMVTSPGKDSDYCFLLTFLLYLSVRRKAHC